MTMNKFIRSMLYFMTIVLFLLFLAGCSKTNTDAAASSKTTGDVNEKLSHTELVIPFKENNSENADTTTVITREAQDFTIDNSEISFIDINKDIAGILASGAADFLYTYSTAQELSEIAPVVVMGVVKEISYSDDNARATTLYDFHITEVFRGDLVVNDIISVEEYGGYVRGDIYAERFGDGRFEKPLTSDNLIYFEYVEGSPAPEIGDEYILFLAESDIIDGAYSIIGTHMGKYYIEETKANRFNPYADLPVKHVEPEELDMKNVKFVVYECEVELSDLISDIKSTDFNQQLFNARFN